MATPILATKLYIPPLRPRMVERPRLIKRLREDMQRKLTLISAPAGFGKTTLVSAWIADCGRPVAWLSLDEGDRDLTRFMTYLVAAVQTLAPELGVGILAALQSAQAAPTEALLTTLVNEIATVPEPFVLVLDDYHAVDSQAVDQALAFLVDHLPPQLHLVVITREDPPLPLSRLRARGQLTELRVADLRFTPAEAAGFLNQVMGLTLSEQDIATLETRTEGWIAGLQLAALSMQGQPDMAGFIKTFTGSHAFVLDYLVEEVLHKQPASVQTFLLRTSILERLCGPLCDAILRDDAMAGQAALEYLDRANLFLIPLDNERRWYRYHHLFADLLRARLLKEQPDQMPDLHLRASIWYEQNDFPSAAIHHALAARDYERAAALIELTWLAMDASFQTNTWLAWAKELPEDMIRLRPVLSLDYAWALINRGEMEAAQIRVHDAERGLSASASDDELVVVDQAQLDFLPSSIASARAYIVQANGDIAGSIRYARQALDLTPETDLVRRGQAGGLLSLAHWSVGDLEVAYGFMADAMASFYATGNHGFAISCTAGLGPIRMVQGRLHDAARIYEQTLQIALEQGEPIPGGTADLYFGLSEIHRERGALEIAEQHLLAGEALGERAGMPDWQHRLYVTQAQLQMTRHDLDSALVLLDKADQVYYRTPLPDVRPVAALKARIWLLQGRLSEALDWARQRSLSPDDDLSYIHEFDHITLARILIAQYRRNGDERSIQEAARLLERLLKTADDGGRMSSVIEILLLLALCHEAQGDSASALAPLERALALAEPEGYVRLFVDEGPPMGRLLAEAAARGLRPGYVGRLLAAFQAETLPQSRADTHATQPLIDPLSERELEVLRLIADGLSNSEIAERLFLALSTVKGHNRIIFDKLQVQRRTEAVARARELGLLSL